MLNIFTALSQNNSKYIITWQCNQFQLLIHYLVWDDQRCDTRLGTC